LNTERVPGNHIRVRAAGTRIRALISSRAVLFHARLRRTAFVAVPRVALVAGVAAVSALLVAATVAGVPGFVASVRADEPLATRGGEPGEVVERRTLSAAELANQAEVIYARMVRGSQRVAAMLWDARRNQDQARARCLDGVLTEYNAQLRIIGDRASRIRDAAARSATDEVRHHAGVLRVAERNARELDRRGNACVGITGIQAVREGTVVEMRVRNEPEMGAPSDDLWRGFPVLPPPAPR
jgi:hypothetical protein